MKKLLCVIIMMFALVCLLASCDEHTHDYGEWENVTNPTCTVDGSKVRYCTCGEEQIKPIYATGHIETTYSAVDATCTNTGLTEGKFCSVCKEVTLAQTVVPALGHTEVVDEAVDATCTETGLTEGKHCSVCGTVTVAQNVVSAKEHTEVIDSKVEATCTTTGLTEGKHCSVCGTVTVAQNVVPANGHTEEIDEAVAPTCTETGLTEGKHCTVCNKVLVAQTVSNKVDHKVVDEKCQYCGVNSYLLQPKDDIAVLKQVCLKIGAEFSYVSTVISDHSSKCNNSACMLNVMEILPDYEDLRLEFYYFEYEINLLDAKIAELENAEKIDIQKVNELKADIERVVDSSYYGGDWFITGLEALEDDFIYLNCHITSVVIPDGTESITPYMFKGYSGITSITIPDSVTRIDAGAFENCSSLTSIVIPDSVTSINSWAFYNCSSLTSIVIPDSVTSIGYKSFGYCSLLTTINFEGTIEQWNAIQLENEWNYSTPATEVICSNGTVPLK